MTLDQRRDLLEAAALLGNTQRWLTATYDFWNEAREDDDPDWAVVLEPARLVKHLEAMALVVRVLEAVGQGEPA